MPSSFLVSLSMEETFFQWVLVDFIVAEVILCFFILNKNGIGIEIEDL